MAAIGRAFGPVVPTSPTQVGEQVAVSSVEWDVLQQASDVLRSELQTPGVQRAQDLIQHVLDCSDGGGYDPSMPG